MDTPLPVRQKGLFALILATPLLLNALVFAIIGFPKVTPSRHLEQIIPPGWVFSVVWTINYLCLGAAWAFSAQNGWAHLIVLPLLALLLSWTPVYTRGDKKSAFYIIMASLFFALLFFAYGKRVSKMLLVPLITWLLTASQFSYDELSQSPPS